MTPTEHEILIALDYAKSIPQIGEYNENAQDYLYTWEVVEWALKKQLPQKISGANDCPCCYAYPQDGISFCGNCGQALKEIKSDEQIM